MIKIGTVTNYLRVHDSMEDCLLRYMKLNRIDDDDVINLVPDRDNPRHELHIYYKVPGESF